MYTVITYGADGNVLSQWTSPPGYAAIVERVGIEDVPQQLARNALHLPGAVVAKVWDGGTGDGDPILTLAAGS